MEWCWAYLTCFIFLKYYNKNNGEANGQGQLPTVNYQQTTTESTAKPTTNNQQKTANDRVNYQRLTTNRQQNMKIFMKMFNSKKRMESTTNNKQPTAGPTGMTNFQQPTTNHQQLLVGRCRLLVGNC